METSALPDNSGKKWHQKLFTCEGLTYTVPQLWWSIFLILMGFFCYTLALAFVPSIMPLKLNALGANSKTIAFIMTTIGQVFNITICPMVSFQSDRFRSKRWGRRVPFILYTMPMFCASWLLFAFVDSEAGFLSNFLQKWVSIAPATMAVILIALIMVIYQFFLMYVGSVIYYIYNDTMPAQFLARFVGAVNVVCQCASACFNFFIFKHGLTHFTPLLILITVVYAVGLGLMCFLLKEPRFPPPTTAEKKKEAGLLAFLKESFSHPFYWYTYLSVAAMAIAGVAGPFIVFRYQNLGLDLAMVGNLNGYAGICATVWTLVVVAIGTTFIDRWHPVRVYAVGAMFISILSALGMKWLFFSPPGQTIWWILLFSSISTMVFSSFWGIASMPMLMRIFPKSRFGQLCGAQAMLRSLTVLLFSFLVGVLIDFLKFNCQLGDFAYRYTFVWQLIWQMLGAYFYIRMYREWLKLGGFSGYKAPAPWLAEKFEVMAVTPVQAPSSSLVRQALLLFDLVAAGPVIGALCMFFYAGMLGAAELSRCFIMLALPVSVVAAAAWFFIRLGILRDIKLASTGLSPRNGIPHHGILFLVGACHVLLFACCVYQSWMLTAPEYGTLSARMWAYESVVTVLLFFGIYLYTRIERGFSNQIEA